MIDILTVSNRYLQVVSYINHGGYPPLLHAEVSFDAVRMES
jgi:hypothetical protein